MNLIDRSIAWAFPGTALRRLQQRAALALAQRAYESAKTGRRVDGWTTGGNSANAEIGTAAATTRHRIRDLVRNNPHAAQAVRKLAAKSWGTGIQPRLRTEDRALRTAYADQWQAFADSSDPEGQLNFYGQINLAHRTMFESGEALIRFLPRRASWRLMVPLQIEVLEPDWLDANKTERLEDGGAIIQGVEYDAAGRRAAYWLYREHPGEVLPYRNGVGAYGLQSYRVPASEVLHFFDPQRPGQARGISMFTPSVVKLRDIDDYDDAELVRKKIAACFVGFVKNIDGDSATNPGTETAADGRRLESFSPGRLQYLRPGEDIEFGSPPNADGYVDYMRFQLRAVAAGLGVTYEQLTGDLSGVNYSSIRVGAIDFWDFLDHLQWNVAIPQICQRVWNRVDRLMVALGERRAVGAPVAWTPPRRRLVDPGKEIAASRDAVRSGFQTLRDAIAEMGEDPDRQIEEIADTNALLDKLGIGLDSDGRRPQSGGTPAAPAATADAPAPIETE
jgi:lambda family phage portal protein